MVKNLTLKIGDINLSFSIENPEDLVTLRVFYHDFLVSEGKPDIEIEICDEYLPDIKNWTTVFDSGGVWRLLSNNGQLAICLSTPLIGPDPYQICILNNSFNRGVVYKRKISSDLRVTPFDHPLMENIIVNILARGKGTLVHGCAILDNGIGRLFMGKSGMGKSTMARLWAVSKGVTVLSDDRVIIRQNKDRFWMYGTPWHGEAGFSSPNTVPVDKIYFIRHSNRNEAQLLKTFDAISRALINSFPTFWNTSGMEFTIDFFADLCNEIPCYDLGFQPEPEVLGFLRCLD